MIERVADTVVAAVAVVVAVLSCSTIETVAGAGVVVVLVAVLRCSMREAVADVVLVGICTDSSRLRHTTAPATTSPTATATVCLLEHLKTASATATAKTASATAIAKTAFPTATAKTAAATVPTTD
jgi:hypothetical protein